MHFPHDLRRAPASELRAVRRGGRRSSASTRTGDGGEGGGAEAGGGDVGLEEAAPGLFGGSVVTWGAGDQGAGVSEERSGVSLVASGEGRSVGRLGGD